MRFLITVELILMMQRMKWILLFFTLLSIVPSPWALSGGAPLEACGDLMPQHGVSSAPDNPGFFLLSDTIENGTYEPGQTYQGKTLSTK